MLSKIRIDINDRNEPIILVEWVNSDDIRDKLVKRFIEGFGHESNEAVMKFEDQKPGEYTCISITPRNIGRKSVKQVVESILGSD